MIAITDEDGLELTNGAEMLERTEQAGKAKSVVKYKTESGFAIEFVTEGQSSFYYMDADDERSIDCLLRANCSHLSDEDRELELYRWGLEEPEEATLDSFGIYRLLLTNVAGHINWYRDEGKAIVYPSLAEALTMSQSNLLANEKPMVI
jgi:hypothetical protein